MQRLRTLTLLRLWALAWFACSLAAAVASPLVKPQQFERVCSMSGTFMLVAVGADEDGGAALGSMGTDCPLCASHAGAPPPLLLALPPRTQPLAHAMRPIEAARLVAATAAPLPARGPPALN